MFTQGVRSTVAARVNLRGFSSSASRASDLARLTLIGRLGREPELRTTKSDKEYISYSVATTNYPPPPPNPDGTRPPSSTTWHHVLSFNSVANNYLRTLPRGAHVFVEANYEVRDPDPAADSQTPQGQRQIFLRHEYLRVLKYPNNPTEESS